MEPIVNNTIPTTSPLPAPTWAREVIEHSPPLCVVAYFDQPLDRSPTSIQAIVERVDCWDEHGADEGDLTVGLYLGADLVDILDPTPAMLRELASTIMDAADRLAKIQAAADVTTIALDASVMSDLFPGQVIDATLDDSSHAIVAAAARLDELRPAPSSESVVWSIPEAALRTGRSIEQVRLAVASGVLNSHCTASGFVVIWTADLDAWSLDAGAPEGAA